MKAAIAAAAIVTAVNALVARDVPCCFSLNASGGASGAVGQILDGQSRLGGGLSPAHFCIDSSGSITDGTGRGCILTRKSFWCVVQDKPTNRRLQLPQPNCSVIQAPTLTMASRLTLMGTYNTMEVLPSSSVRLVTMAS